MEATEKSKIAAAYKITETSLDVFLRYAEDAGNWSGSPLVYETENGKAERGNLTQLKRAGLITTDFDEGQTWISFTKKGTALATELKIWLGNGDQGDYREFIKL